MRGFAVRANVPLLAKRRRRFLLSEDGATAFEYALISALLSAFGFVVYRMLRMVSSDNLGHTIPTGGWCDATNPSDQIG